MLELFAFKIIHPSEAINDKLKRESRLPFLKPYWDTVNQYCPQETKMGNAL